MVIIISKYEGLRRYIPVILMYDMFISISDNLYGATLTDEPLVQFWAIRSLCFNLKPTSITTAVQIRSSVPNAENLVDIYPHDMETLSALLILWEFTGYIHLPHNRACSAEL